MSRRLLVFVMLLVGLVATVIAAPRPAAAACTCQTASVAQGLTDSQVVFTGELIEVIPGEVLDTLKFRVDLVYKGEVTYEIAVATLASSDDCGITDPPLGKWMLFASQFPDATGPLLANTCGPSRPLTAGDDLPAELVNGTPPPDSPVPPTTLPPVPVSIAGQLPADWRPSAIKAGGALVLLGLVARLLMGRRRPFV